MGGLDEELLEELDDDEELEELELDDELLDDEDEELLLDEEDEEDDELLEEEEEELGSPGGSGVGAPPRKTKPCQPTPAVEKTWSGWGT